MFSLLLRTVTVLLTILFAVTSAHAYTAYNGCPNLSNLGASYVEAYTGRTWEPMQDKGVVEGRHTVISTQGTDPYTDNKLKLLPEGATSVVRLGNDLAEAETDVLVYHFRVDADNPILKLRYAVVMENPGHAKDEQPRFNLQVLDVSGRLINDNSSYDVYASANAAGFHTSAQKGKLGSSIIWCDWSSMGVDLSSKVGQEVQIRISTYDCGAFEHFAYAYFTAECIEKTLYVERCQSDKVTFSAPEGFASYKWSNGSTERSTTVPKNTTNSSVSCIVRSATGSEFVLVGVITSLSNIKAEDYEVTVTTGDSYEVDGIVLPTDAAREVIMNYYDPATCAFKVGKKIRIKLDSKKPYIQISKGICEGESYEEYGFRYIKPAVGTYYDTLPCTTCRESYPQYYTLRLTVSQPPVFPTIEGPLNVCEGEPAVFIAKGGEDLSTYQWKWKEGGVEHVSYSPTLSLDFEDSGSKTISLTAGNGCNSKTQSVKLNVHENYKKVYFDTVCIGTKYSKYGFNLGTLSEEGKIVRNKNLQTVYGCDSLVVLSLVVAPEVKVRIDLKGDSVLCEGKEIKLTAKGGLDYEQKEEPDHIRIGDIHCTDGTILHPADFSASGKTADGVVVFLDETGEHGTVASLSDKEFVYSKKHIENSQIQYDSDFYLGGRVSTVDYLRPQLDGKENTLIRKNYTYNDNFFLKDFDYDSEWYIPSYGEMYLLYSTITDIEESMAIVGGSNIDLEARYLTCTSNSISRQLVTCLTWFAAFNNEMFEHEFPFPYVFLMRLLKKF